MSDLVIQQITEEDFLKLVKEICSAEHMTERQHTNAILEFERLCEHPDGSDLIYYPKPLADNSPAGIVKTIKEWRVENGKPGFKSEK
ncbi:bacteriocin immunity protein [Pseudomonas sp. NPDC087358]|uniref:bacteriocin immunity protein n=1 Tax=Pseudomonas sp. NPDC087358 TaxID=3364439 RepID=UPI00384E43E9